MKHTLNQQIFYNHFAGKHIIVFQVVKCRFSTFDQCFLHLHLFCPTVNGSFGVFTMWWIDHFLTNYFIFPLLLLMFVLFSSWIGNGSPVQQALSIYFVSFVFGFKLKKCLLLKVNFLLREDDLIWSAWTCLQIQWSTIQWLYVVLIYFICCRRVVIVASSVLILILRRSTIEDSDLISCIAILSWIKNIIPSTFFVHSIRSFCILQVQVCHLYERAVFDEDEL